MEKENNKVHITNHTSRQNTQCREVVKLTYKLRLRECTSSSKYQVEKENNKFHIIVHKCYEAGKSNLPTEQVHKSSK